MVPTKIKRAVMSIQSPLAGTGTTMNLATAKIAKVAVSSFTSADRELLIRIDKRLEATVNFMNSYYNHMCSIDAEP